MQQTYGWTVYILLSLDAVLIAVVLSAVLRHPRWVLEATIVAWGSRLVVMGLLKLMSFNRGLGGFYPGDIDSRMYHAWAVRTLESGSPGTTILIFYSWVVANLYRVFGVDISAAQLVNLGLSVLCLPLIVQLSRKLYGLGAGRTGAILWAVLPSGILWSVSLLKDIWVVLGVLCAAFLIIGVARGVPTLAELVVGVLGILLIGLFRAPMLASFVLALIIVSLARARLSWGAIVVSVGLIFGMFALGNAIDNGRVWHELTRATSAAGVADLSRHADLGNTNIGLVAGVSPAVRWIVQMPFSVFAPFPWQWGLMGSGFGRLAGAEMIVLYGIYYLLWRDRRRILGNPRSRALFIFASLIFVAVSFSIPNVGSIYRYRWPALALMLPLITPGLSAATGSERREAGSAGMRAAPEVAGV